MSIIIWFYLLFNQNQLTSQSLTKEFYFKMYSKNHKATLTLVLFANGHPSKFEPWQSKLDFDDQIRINCTYVAKIINSKFFV